MQAERRTLWAKESQLLDMRKSIEGQVAVLGAELRAAQAPLADLTSQRDGAHGRVNTLTAKHDVAAVREVTMTRSLRTTEVARDALSRDAY